MASDKPDRGQDSSGEVVLQARHGSTLIITMNRPSVMNAINAKVASGIGAALEEAERRSDIRAVVLTGAGRRAFSAGADLKEVSLGMSLAVPGHPEWGFAGFVSHEIAKPTIAAVQGFAVGGGLEMVLAADLVVASSEAKFGLPEVSRGIVAAAGGAFRLANQMPPRVALEYVLTGEMFDAQVALHYGLINAVVDADLVLETALEMADRIAKNAPLAVEASKRLAKGLSMGLSAPNEARNWGESARIRGMLAETGDASEGARAFIEKREPRWKGE